MNLLFCCSKARSYCHWHQKTASFGQILVTLLMWAVQYFGVWCLLPSLVFQCNVLVLLLTHSRRCGEYCVFDNACLSTGATKSDSLKQNKRWKGWDEHCLSFSLRVAVVQCFLVPAVRSLSLEVVKIAGKGCFSPLSFVTLRLKPVFPRMFSELLLYALWLASQLLLSKQ